MSNYSRVVLITGVSSGIGQATAELLIKEGHRVIGDARSQDKLTALSQSLGKNFIGVSGDASDDKHLEDMFNTALNHFKAPVDAVIVNAGRGLSGSVKDADLSQFDAILKLNVSGAAQLLQQAARRMVDVQSAHFPHRAADIVVIGSVVGRHISPFGATYSATKFAVHCLTESLRREIGPKGVRVTLIEPGVVVSGFQEAAGYKDDVTDIFNEKFGPLLQPIDIANTIVFSLNQPPHIHVSNIMVRPTRQDYP
ncbi:putative oxidoreductase [Ferrovum sp. JA12]|uniref:SDR family oxidoreductase n=1 Tax=Ferrovum sp. JA12 TaxID=1356299 RepID=UPI0007028CED|nr:SDR family oxidoreductase [Ferrovum sp. JA12]KRH78261.1 putative oxidoreductase [Ferrovum sp. JA12]